MRGCVEKRAVFGCVLTSHWIPYDKRVLSLFGRNGDLSLPSRATSEVVTALQFVARSAEFLQLPPSGIFSAPGGSNHQLLRPAYWTTATTEVTPITILRERSHGLQFLDPI